MKDVGKNVGKFTRVTKFRAKVTPKRLLVKLAREMQGITARYIPLSGRFNRLQEFSRPFV